MLRNNEVVSIYHTSFADFVNGKTIELNEQIHINIAKHVLLHQLTTFGISERVYHLSQGDEHSKKEAIEQCNQSWIDDCALNSINPDIVLDDVKGIIGLAAEMGLAHKVIALLLLSQRINFRYNTLFQENATFIVNALLALNKPDEAIRYVVRNKTLTTSDGDALYLLQQFFEHGADHEAEILLDTIDKTCQNIFESGIDENSFNRWIYLRFNSLTLSSNLNLGNAMSEFLQLKSATVAMLEANNNTEDVIHEFKDSIASYQYGYLIWRFNVSPITKQMEGKFHPNNKTSGFIALAISQALRFQSQSPIIKSENNLSDWIADLEYVIDTYGTHNDYYFIIVFVLLGRTKRKDIIENLYKQLYSSVGAFDIRDDNGVDLNNYTLRNLMLYSQSQGLLDETDQFPELPVTAYMYNNWEHTIIQVFKYIHFCKGKADWYRITEDYGNIKALQPKILLLVEKIIPDLKRRIHWERSYALPETIAPLMYKDFIHLLMDYFPEQIPVFVEKIEKKTYYQLGLYTEGYTNSLLSISRELAKKSSHNVSAFKVAKVLEQHIVSSIENREERNEYLLRLVEIYAFLDNEDKARAAFKEMIDTSMGPSWYKEAQLGIINTAVSSIIPSNGNLSYLQKFAAHLHNASGEMTFQRYVKEQQENFVGDLAKIGFLDKSIAYFKYLLFPDYRTILTNAESSVSDMPNVGDGYVLGARAIEEQSGILYMLSGINCEQSLIAWALCELFVLGDDRYLNGYVEIQSNILNQLEKTDPEKLDKLFNRIAKFIVTEVSDDFRHDYIQVLFNKLSTTNYERAKKCLEAIGMTQSNQEGESKREISSASIKEGQDPLDKLIEVKELAEQLISIENPNKARKVIIEALKEVQNNKYGIWHSNFSNRISDVRNLLSKTYNNSGEFIKDVKDLIVNEPYREEWVIANQIIKLLNNIDDEQEKQLILTSVLEHIDLMVRTTNSVYDKYSWLSNSSEKISPDQQDRLLLELLIWFLNHPSLIVKNRTIETLAWLGTIEPSMILSALIGEILSEGYKVSKELSASVIHQISSLNPAGFSDLLKNSIEKQEDAILKVEHFMIRNTLLDSFNELKYKGANDLDALIGKFEATYSIANNRGGDIIIEEDYLEPIKSYIYDLEKMGILTKQFAKALLAQVEKLAPLPIKECLKANRYINRSFNDSNKIILIADFDTLLRYSLNIAISNCTSLENRKDVSDILRFYQPTFPENKLEKRIENGTEAFDEIIKNLFEKDNFDFSKVLLNNELPLDYYGKKYSDSSNGKSAEDIELRTFIIPLDEYNPEEHFYPLVTFYANNYSDTIEYDEDTIGIPLTIECSNASTVTGSELVPSVLNPQIDSLIPGIKGVINSVYWRRGRNWNNHKKGEAQRTGYYTTIPKSKVTHLSASYKLVWEISLGYNTKYIDVFGNIEI